MEKKHDLIFCAQCGVKLDGNEIICPVCGYKLAELNPFQNTETPVPPIPTPVVPPPLTNPINQNIPPVTDQNYYQQPQQSYYPPKNKGMGAGWWILIIFFILAIVGGSAVAFLQYNGNISIEILRDYIPSKDSQNSASAIKTEDPTRYYVVHSFAVIGTRWTVIISDVIVSRKKFNNEEGAKNQFKKAIMYLYPRDYHYFLSNAIANKYMNYPAAQSGHSSTLKNYGRDIKNYDIRTVNFDY